MEVKNMEMEIKEKAGFKVVGIGIDTSVQECIKNNKIPALWKKFIDELWMINNRVDGKNFYGLSLTTGECSFNHIACVEVSNIDEVPKDMVAKEIPGSRYAVWTYKGKMPGLTEAYRWLYEEGMPKSGLKQKKDLWLEKYDERYKDDSDESIMEIWIPIED